MTKDYQTKLRNSERDGASLSGFYDYFSYRGEYIRCSTESLQDKYIQQRIHGDVIVRIGRDTLIAVDEKNQTGRWSTMLIETMQSTETGKKGWIYTSRADYILYTYPFSATVDGEVHKGREVFLVPLGALRTWFKAHSEEYPVLLGFRCPNVPESVVVPLQHVVENVPTRKFLVTDEVVEVELYEDATIVA